MLNQKMPVTESATPNLFWGIVLKSDKRYEQTVEEDFHISKACIEPNPNNGKICSVYLEQDNEEFILCNLSQKNLNESLDLNFSESEKICFRVEGGGTVHLTGYLVPQEDDPMYPMGDMSDDEEEDEEEAPPMLVKKRKLENGAAPKGEKKTKKDEIEQAQAMKKVLEKKGTVDSEEDSSEDDSEDMDESEKVKNPKKNETSNQDKPAGKAEGQNSDDNSNGNMDHSEVTEGSSFFDSTAAEDDDEDESGEDEESDEEDDGEDDDESSSDEDSEEASPTPKSVKKEKIETPKSGKKEKIETPKSIKKEKKVETPVQKKENKPENTIETPSTKKDKKNSQLTNGGTPKPVNGTQTPKNESKTPSKNKESEQTPKNKDAKTPSKDIQAAQTPNKTPKRTLKGGLMVEDIKVGNGPEAKAGKLVGMYYDGKLKSNNKRFDAQQQGKPFKFRLGRGEVIKGWDLGVEGMKVGGKRRLTVPANLGYGSQGAPPDIPPNATLVFDVECKMVN